MFGVLLVTIVSAVITIMRVVNPYVITTILCTFLGGYHSDVCASYVHQAV